MGTVLSFVEDFLPAQQFASALGLLVVQCPEADLREKLSSGQVTALVPADSGLVHAAAEFGYTGHLASEALRFLISETARQLGVPPLEAMLRIVLAHIAQGDHSVPQPGSSQQLRMFSGEDLALTVTGIVASVRGDRTSLMVCDQTCDNGVVHVISCPILPSGMHPRVMPRPAARPPVPQRVNGFAAPPQDRYRTGFYDVSAVDTANGAASSAAVWQAVTPTPSPPSAVARPRNPHVTLDPEQDIFRFDFDR